MDLKDAVGGDSENWEREGVFDKILAALARDLHSRGKVDQGRELLAFIKLRGVVILLKRL